MPNIQNLPDGRPIALVPRSQLRFSLHSRFLCVAPHLQALMQVPIPTPPAKFSGSKNRAVKYPMLGNDQYGDCYYADMCHQVQTFTGNATPSEASFDLAAVVQRYLQLSGGDNGLADQQVFPEWKAGIVGPNGPHKILDEMTVDPQDDNKIRLGMWLFCGASFTAALPDQWIKDAAPGAWWRAGFPNPNNGHAMHLSGYDFTDPNNAYYEDETWGFDPSIKLAPDGLKSALPEITLQFSLEMFNAAGVAPHNGMGYDDLATLWKVLGGSTLPPNPWTNPPTPGPTPTPTPTPPPGPTPPPIPLPPWILILEPLLLELAKLLCSQVGRLPSPWNTIFGDLCQLMPKGADGKVASIPPWLLPAVLKILQIGCTFAPSLPPPYGPLATMICGLLPKSEAAPCSGCP